MPRSGLKNSRIILPNNKKTVYINCVNGFFKITASLVLATIILLFTYSKAQVSLNLIAPIYLIVLPHRQRLNKSFYQDEYTFQLKLLLLQQSMISQYFHAA